MGVWPVCGMDSKKGEAEEIDKDKLIKALLLVG
jgi:hypothetical protein